MISYYCLQILYTVNDIKLANNAIISSDGR